jgi:hypothetical protein
MDPIPVALGFGQIERLQGPVILREMDTMHEASWKGYLVVSMDTRTKDFALPAMRLHLR